MDSNDQRLDDLIERLRARAADPKRRADVLESRFVSQTRALDFGGVANSLGSIAGSLRRTVAANRQGRVDPEGHDLAVKIEADMTTPAFEVPGPAAEADINSAEARLGYRLPAALRRVYLEVADGGFGPGAGLFGLSRIVTVYHEVQDHPVIPAGSSWPPGILPIVDRDPGYDCIEVATGRVLAWDPERMTEHSGERAWQQCFSEVSPSIDGWLGEWAVSPTLEEQLAPRLAEYRVEEARRARARIGAMTPEERAAMGLPEVGWERVVWGGLGWDPDEDPVKQ
jgi:hypothetical protein